MKKCLSVTTLVAIGLVASALGYGQATGQAPNTPAPADSFGPGIQSVTIPAAAFQHLNNDSGYEMDWASNGYLAVTDYTFLGVFVAPLVLPVGAEIVQICTYFFDTEYQEVTTLVDAIKLPEQGEEAAVVPVFGPFSNGMFEVGYGKACGTGSYTYRETADVDGDGSAEDVAHRIRVEMPWVDEGSLMLGAVRVYWRRQVSPPPDTPTFLDVPSNDNIFKFVEALAASGITAGCGNGNFCPNSPLTRGQMAVFLAKALGLHWPN